ncbi:MAG: APC family permease [Luminiphilus sp.]
MQQHTSPDGADNTVKRTRVPLFSAFFMIYIFVSGGSFGIEEMVSSSGPGLTLILLLAFPFIWALPMALIASELGSAMPHSGGFYVWTRRGLGQFWGFQAAWWWSLALLVDTSLYIVLSATYLQHQIGFSDTLYYLICWSIIALFTTINLMGIRVVAIGSSLFAILIISPILVLAFVGIANWQFNPFIPITPPDTDLLGTDGALILGLSVGLWMYSGYESMSTLAGEIEEPQRIIPKALMLALPFVALMYLLPTAASIASFGHWELFSVDSGGGKVSFVDIGRALGGSALGHALLASAVLGNLALYLDYMASGARPIQSLARDGLLPPMLASTSSRFGTPVMAILLIAGVNAILVIGPFQSLVIIDVLLMVSSYALIFIAAVRLRITEPDLVRPFKIPGGKIAMILLVLPPMALIVLMVTITLGDHSLMLWDHDRFSLLGVEIGWYGLAGLVAILSGPLLYPLLSKQ